MIALIKKDIRLSFGNRETYFVLLFYPLLLLFFLGGQEIEVMLFGNILALTFIITMISFVYDTRDNSRYFLHSLPIKRWEVVLGKYLSVLLYYGLSLFFVYLYGWVLEIFGIEIMSFFTRTLIEQSLILTLLSLSVALPLFYIFPPKIARVLYMFLFILLNNFFLLEKDVSIIGKIPYPYLAGGIFLVSMGISMGIYKSKDID